MPDQFEPTLRDVFIDLACEAWSDALDAATAGHVGMPESAVKHHRWDSTTPEQRKVAAVAMSAFLDWLDDRRF